MSLIPNQENLQHQSTDANAYHKNNNDSCFEKVDGNPEFLSEGKKITCNYKQIDTEEINTYQTNNIETKKENNINALLSKHQSSMLFLQ